MISSTTFTTTSTAVLQILLLYYCYWDHHCYYTLATSTTRLRLVLYHVYQRYIVVNNVWYIQGFRADDAHRLTKASTQQCWCRCVAAAEITEVFNGTSSCCVHGVFAGWLYSRSLHWWPVTSAPAQLAWRRSLAQSNLFEDEHENASMAIREPPMQYPYVDKSLTNTVSMSRFSFPPFLQA